MAERISTISAIVRVDTREARQQYDEYRQYVADNPARTRVVGDATRTTSTFGGGSVTSTAPPLAIPPAPPLPLTTRPPEYQIPGWDRPLSSPPITTRPPGAPEPFRIPGFDPLPGADERFARSMDELRRRASASAVAGGVTGGAGPATGESDKRITDASKREAEARERAAVAAERRSREIERFADEEAPSRRPRRRRSRADIAEARIAEMGPEERRRFEEAGERTDTRDKLRDLRRELFDEPRRRLDELRRRRGPVDEIAEDIEAVPLTEEEERRFRGGGRRGRDRWGRFNRLVGAGFIAFEGLRVAEAYMNREQAYRIARGDPFKQIQAEQQFQQTIGGVPIVGQAAMLAGQAAQQYPGAIGRFAGGVIDALNPFGGFGGAPTTFRTGKSQTTAEAEADARRGIEDQLANTARALQAQRDQAEAAQYARQRAIVQSGDPVTQRLLTIRSEREDFHARMEAERYARRQAIDDAATTPDVQARLKSDFKSWSANAAERAARFDELSRSREGATVRQQIWITEAIRQNTAASRYERRGDRVAAGVAALRAQFAQYEPIYGRDGGIVAFGKVDNPDDAAALKAQYDEGRIGVGLSETQRSLVVQGGLTASRLLRAHRPLEAAIADINAKAAAEKVGVFTQAENDRIFDQRTEAIARVRQQYAEQRTDTATALAAQKASLQSALRREPGAAGEAYTASAQAIIESRALARGGDTAGARAELVNAQLQLQLLRQNYFDAFRPVQLEGGRLIATQGGRQSEDPKAVITAVEKGVQDIINALNGLAAN